MCQAIVKPAGYTVEKHVLKTAWNENPHGGGFAYVEGNQVIVKKGFFSFKKFWRAYRHIEDRPALIHFRFATHGPRIEENCHPFQLDEQAAIAHNGVLLNYAPMPKDERSDTRVFLDRVVSPAIKSSGVPASAFLHDVAAKAVITQLIGSSKLAAITPAGFVIFNESLGEWKDGVWFSAGWPLDSALAGFCFGGYGYNETTTYQGKYGGTWKPEPKANRKAWESVPEWEEEMLAEAEARETWSYSDNEDEDHSCAMCENPNRALIRVGVDSLCMRCWKDVMTDMATN